MGETSVVFFLLNLTNGIVLLSSCFTTYQILSRQATHVTVAANYGQRQVPFRILLLNCSSFFFAKYIKIVGEMTKLGEGDFRKTLIRNILGIHLIQGMD